MLEEDAVLGYVQKLAGVLEAAAAGGGVGRTEKERVRTKREATVLLASLVPGELFPGG